MGIYKGIAAVTGGSGIIGRRITQKLLHEGYEVRVLTRNELFRDDSVQVYYGDLEDMDVLRLFLKNVTYLFHCAAETNIESKMWNVNVLGTEMILRLLPSSDVIYFCYLSSAGVIGLTDSQFVDERSKCNPRNTYEKTKWAAEELVAKGAGHCSIVILRPTNVIDDARPGALSLPIRGALLDRFMVLLKGGECAHIIHAEDVAAAALYFVTKPIEGPQCFFVSCDDEPLNTYAGLWSLYKVYSKNNSLNSLRLVLHLPLIVPYLLRMFLRGKGNKGNVHYSSDKLVSSGFVFPLGLHGAIRRLIAFNNAGVQ